MLRLTRPGDVSPNWPVSESQSFLSSIVSFVSKAKRESFDACCKGVAILLPTIKQIKHSNGFVSSFTGVELACCRAKCFECSRWIETHLGTWEFHVNPRGRSGDCEFECVGTRTSSEDDRASPGEPVMRANTDGQRLEHGGETLARLKFSGGWFLRATPAAPGV